MSASRARAEEEAEGGGGSRGSVWRGSCCDTLCEVGCSGCSGRDGGGGGGGGGGVCAFRTARCERSPWQSSADKLVWEHQRGVLSHYHSSALARAHRPSPEAPRAELSRRQQQAQAGAIADLVAGASGRVAMTIKQAAAIAREANEAGFYLGIAGGGAGVGVFTSTRMEPDSFGVLRFGGVHTASDSAKHSGFLSSDRRGGYIDGGRQPGPGEVTRADTRRCARGVWLNDVIIQRFGRHIERRSSASARSLGTRGGKFVLVVEPLFYDRLMDIQREVQEGRYVSRTVGGYNFDEVKRWHAPRTLGRRLGPDGPSSLFGFDQILVPVNTGFFCCRGGQPSREVCLP